jgi:hypothetical protein
VIPAAILRRKPCVVKCAPRRGRPATEGVGDRLDARAVEVHGDRLRDLLGWPLLRRHAGPLDEHALSAQSGPHGIDADTLLLGKRWHADTGLIGANDALQPFATDGGSINV